jgi:hypothetical protein
MKIAAPGHEYDPRWPDPLWLAVHEAGHVIARVQLVAAWRLAELDDLVCLESFRSDAIRPVRREGLAREATRSRCPSSATQFFGRRSLLPMHEFGMPNPK